MRIAAIGRTNWLFDSIVALKDAGHSIVLVATSKAAPEYGVGEHDFEKLAKNLDCRYFCDVSLNRPEHVELIRSLKADVAISVNWPTLIGRDVFQLFRHGIVNAHAGDLPRFRGNACPNWAILSGEDKVVLTLHQMSEGLDAGPILSKKALRISEDTYIADVYKFLSAVIPDAYVEAMAGLASGNLIPHAQSLAPMDSLRCFPRLPADGEINWEFSAQTIVRLVRASAEPFSGAFTYLAGNKLIVWRAHSGKLDYPYLGVPGQVVGVDYLSRTVTVLAGEGVVLLEEVEIGCERKKASEIIRSTRMRFSRNFNAKLLELEKKVEALDSIVRQALSGNDDDR